MQQYSLFNAAQILTLLLLLLSSIAVTAAVPYLNYNTKPLFFNGKNSFLPKEEKTAARKKKKQQPEKEKAAQGLTPCAAETHLMYQFI